MNCSVLIPTVGDRDTMLAQVIAAYSAEGHDVRVIYGHTWGGGCNALAETETADYMLFACDDKLPRLGWFDHAKAMLDSGAVPQSRNLTYSGFPLHELYDDALGAGEYSDWTRDFFLTPAIWRQVGPLLDTTWYTDIEYSARLNAAGWALRVCDGFTFTHLDGPREWRTQAVDARERQIYEAARG